MQSFLLQEGETENWQVFCFLPVRNYSPKFATIIIFAFSQCLYILDFDLLYQKSAVNQRNRGRYFAKVNLASSFLFLKQFDITAIFQASYFSFPLEIGVQFLFHFIYPSRSWKYYNSFSQLLCTWLLVSIR